ncbi:DNA repair protein RecO [Myroides odoratimimus CCUG 12700]|uniref:DNA repair protein RecO n=1 Tax=Myroides odoratimimus TaxID=76832 RepID=UPI00035396CE|nr:DNA repair protein RecO [Myroides odoratimimus]EPH10765.1 DNA repair protein RecO [Myroides odoratimimus CCUG 12700]MCO7721726.1 DNA repair protein RecO [Myroides odoratimimus]
MQIKTKAIVLSALKYQEKSLIVKCFTEEAGMVSFFVRNAFAKGKSAQKIAYFQPLTILDIDFIYKNKGGLEYFKEVKTAHVYQDIYYNYNKNCIAIFIGEVLHSVFREPVVDKDFFTFLEAALLWFDTHDEVANFHLILMVELTKYFGFYPASEGKSKLYFNWEEGVFTDHFSPCCFDEEPTFLFRKLIELGFSSDQKVFNNKDRKRLLTMIISYYEQHLNDFRKPNSLEVLKEVFSN